MQKTLACLAITALLVACATPQDRAARSIERHGPYCEGLGFAKGTDAWRNCILKEEARITKIIWSDD